MADRFALRRVVEFSETDMAGIVHFSNFFKYMESVEHAFFRSLGLSIAPGGEGNIGWPRVHADFDFKRPIRFEDTIEIALYVRERRERSLNYLIVVRKVTGSETQEVARGTLAVACIKKDPSGVMRSVPIPPEIAALIQAVPQEELDGLSG